ncbi:hypothetical protein BUALT_Bualt10G0007800 [Buddleja alternifolia]|uniref:SWIM-type domain-containing protein n=1 Tax=Buddleja alternifolia TaxID=168488 RepID=A0AAV6X288_9LAMI|nr:hypothetical protein BUALT_Bualt10G0007800 [Buddleja alternifolia]
MKLRLHRLADQPPPKYKATGHNVTVRFHHGGKLITKPSAEYVGGIVSVYDYVPVKSLCIDILNEMCEGLGYFDSKKFYRLDKSRGKFYEVSFLTDIQMMCDGYITKGRELTFYLDAQLSLFDSDTEVIPNEPVIEPHPHNEPNYRTVDDYVDEYVSGNRDKGTDEGGEGGGEGEGDKRSGGKGGEGEGEGEGDKRCGGEGGEGEGEGEEDDNDCDWKDDDSDSETADEFHESDYEMNDEDDGVEENPQRVDATKGGEVPGCNESSSNDYSEEDMVYSGDDFDSGVESNEEEIEKFPTFDPSDKYKPTFEIGIYFSTKKHFRDAVNSHAVISKRNLKIAKNDARRIYAKCLGKGCDWRINVLKVKGENTFQVREYQPKHKCARTYHVKNANSRWISGKYEGLFRTDPKRSMKGFRKDVVKEIRCKVSRYQAYRAKQKALRNIEGKAEDQYKLLWDYAQELRISNPGSTVILVMEDGVDENGRKKFAKLYICFDALKQGFMAGCRPIVGVDGCHLKGPHGGILLTAVAIDPNNCLYPLAYAVVSSQTRQNWEWFLTLLKEDLNMVRDDAYTFISDKQKGLIPAFHNVLPGVDNRYCVRHLSGNMKTSGGFKGLAYKHALWNAALATTIPDFEVRMKEIGDLDERALEWFHDKPPSQWSKSHFSTFSKCDMLLNNVCESFNSSILEAREKPVITMLEWIREYLMTRLTENRDRETRRWGNKKVCPNIRKIIDKNMERAGDCIAIKSNAWNYEVSCFYDSSRYNVNLHTSSCSCRRWDLSGIPCKHGMSAICDQALNPEDFVHEYYSVNSYNRVYQHAILPVNGQRLWPKTGYIPPLPPNFGRRAGRPSSARRMEPDEPRSKGKKQRGKKPVTLGKQKYKVKCHYCGEQGHNQKGCGKKRKDMVIERGTSSSALGARKTKLAARKRTISEVSEAVPPQPQVQPTSSDTAPISTHIVIMPTPGHNFLPQSTQH